MKTKIINATLLDVENNKVNYNTTVCIDNSNIVFVGENENLLAQSFVSDKVIDFEGDILSAGFINAHNHNAMTLFRGLKDDLPLDKWLFDNMFVIEKYLNKNDIYYGTQLGLLEGLKSGITTNFDSYFNQDAIVQANIDLKTRLVCSVGATQEQNSYNSIINMYKDLPKDNELISYMAYAHSIYTIDTKGLEDTVCVARDYKLPLHIHLAETLNEVGECVQKYNKTPIQLIEDIGFFEHKCLIAHGVHIDKDDYLSIVQKNVSVAHCPSSNMKLGSGIAPIYSMIEAGINVCLGTDGPASNNSIDMFREMYLGSLLQKVNLHETQIMPASLLVKMATINAAKALNLDNKIGKIKEGYKADLVRISINDINILPLNDYYSGIVYSGKPENVKMTMVNGEILYENGKFADFIDTDKIIFECKNANKRLKIESNI